MDFIANDAKNSFLLLLSDFLDCGEAYINKLKSVYFEVNGWSHCFS